MSTSPWIHLLRLVLGFVLAPLVAAVVFSLMQDGHLGFVVPALIYGGYPSAIVLGIPALLLLRRWVQPRLLTIMLVGGIIAMLPWLVLFALPQGEGVHGEVGDCVTTVNGMMTWCGFVGALKFLAVVFPYGALGGLVFWLCVVWRPARPTNPASVAN